MTRQTTLLTSHKGVDLHAASALRVMQDRLEGGERLVNLLRCELHTFWGETVDGGLDRLLNTGRYFNPNKHHYGHFLSAQDTASWLGGDPVSGRTVNNWPGEFAGTDLDGLTDGEALYQRLLGGPVAGGHTAVDVIAFALGQSGPVLSGVLWRLVVSGDPATALDIGRGLAVARGRKDGLLLNPHMEAWLIRS